MRQRDALRPARGAGGVDHVGEVGRAYARGGAGGPPVAGAGLPAGPGVEHRQAGGAQVGRGLGGGDHRHGPGPGDQAPEALGGIAGIERQVGPARLQDPEQGCRELGAAGKEHRHDTLGSHPLGPQAPAWASTSSWTQVWGSSTPGPRAAPSSSSASASSMPSFGRARSGSATGGREQPPVVRRHPGDRGGLEQVGGVLEAGAQLRRPLPGLQREIEGGGVAVGAHRLLPHRVPVAHPLPRPLVLEAHLEQGIAAQVALGLELFDQLLEGRLLVGEGAEGRAGWSQGSSMVGSCASVSAHQATSAAISASPRRWRCHTA